MLKAVAEDLGQVSLEAIEGVLRGTNFKFRHHRNVRITKKQTASTLGAVDYALTGVYDGVMLKHDMLCDGKLHAIAALPEGFRQISRKTDSPEIEQSFANTKPRGEHNAHFDFKIDNWVADVE